jgi:cellobiose-specific phosphotransferase system component IIC
MEAQTYETILIIIGAIFTVLMTAALYIVNQARKDANNNVPPEVAKTLGELIPPSLLPLLIALAKAGETLAAATPTPADDELVHAIEKELTPTPADDELVHAIEKELTPTPHVDSPPALDPNAEG